MSLIKNKAVTSSKCEIKKKYITIEFPDKIEITEEVRAQNIRRIFTGGVRVNNGMYRTDAEKEKYIRESLERKLP